MDVQLNDKLVIESISKGYKGNPAVLKDISFTVRDGEFLSLLGPSGCGKTTLLRILIGLLPADSGKISKDGRDITALPPDKRGMGIVFQNYALFENMTVRQNVEYALKLHKLPKAEVRERSEHMLEAVGLADQSRKYALNPDVVLFDEPMSALDVATRLSMRTELKQLQAKFGTTMLYVTHDQEEAFALSDRIMILDRGEISQLDTPERIASEPANEYVRSFVLDNLQAKVDSLARFIRRGGGAS